MRKILALAAAALLIPAAALAQTWAPSQQGAVGVIVGATDPNGNAKQVVMPASFPAGDLYNHISTNATTTVKSGAGLLHSVCINKAGATANTATIYDNTAGSGTVIAVIDTTAANAVGCRAFNVSFTTGLTIVTATGTAGDLTIGYR